MTRFQKVQSFLEKSKWHINHLQQIFRLNFQSSELFNPSEKLPKNGEYVLAHFPSQPWHSADAKNNEHKWVVVKFVRGISIEERNKLPKTSERKNIFRVEDENGNNFVPYYWDIFGQGGFSGQEASCWCHLPMPEHTKVKMA
jgi:hypothetical protein